MDVPDETSGTAVSCLKGDCLLLQNCNTVRTDKPGLMNDVMKPADCADFSDYMKNIYYTAKRDRNPGTYMDYLNTSEVEYRKIYCTGKWKKLKSDPTQPSMLSIMTIIPVVRVCADVDKEDPTGVDMANVMKDGQTETVNDVITADVFGM